MMNGIKDLTVAADTFHPLSPPIEQMDASYDYSFKAVYVSDKDFDAYQNELDFDGCEAQWQVEDNLKKSLEAGWSPVLVAEYPQFFIPSYQRYSNGKFFIYKGLILCRKIKLSNLLHDDSVKEKGVGDNPVCAIMKHTDLCIKT